MEMEGEEYMNRRAGAEGEVSILIIGMGNTN
jgi:hypothetical protein